jgi:hypothetical protein
MFKKRDLIDKGQLEEFCQLWDTATRILKALPSEIDAERVKAEKQITDIAARALEHARGALAGEVAEAIAKVRLAAAPASADALTSEQQVAIAVAVSSAGNAAILAMMDAEHRGQDLGEMEQTEFFRRASPPLHAQLAAALSTAQLPAAIAVADAGLAHLIAAECAGLRAWRHVRALGSGPERT